MSDCGLISITMPSDPNGNLLSDGQQSYAYDDLDQLISVTRGITTTTFGYNGSGDRA